MEPDLGLGDRDKELKRWNAPYQYREFPKMLFRGTTSTAGRVEVEQRVVGSEGEERAAEAVGWLAHSLAASEREMARLEGRGTAAAERAWTDRHMSPAAQAEVASVEATTAKHLPEIAERPKRVRPSRARKEAS